MRNRPKWMFSRASSSMATCRTKANTKTEFYNLTSISPSVCYRLFGSWKKTVEAYSRANGILLQKRPRTRVTPDILLNELRVVG